MLALGREEAEPRNTHGVLLKDAMNPATRWDVKHGPTIDYSALLLNETQKRYYAKHDTDPAHPMNRAGHMWGISKAE